MAMAVRSEQLDADERRQGVPRAPVGQHSTMRVDDGSPSEIAVDDLSCRGLLFSCPHSLAVGTAVQIGLAGAGSTAAVVVRRDGDKHGAAFVRPLTPAQLSAAFSGGTVIRGLFPSVPGGVAHQLEVASWPRPLRALAWIAAATLPWTALLAAVYR